ncbi:MAG: hypothetical protein E6Z15_26060, partial [Paenibacillus macerans]|nr:hypothetical protein [Paenibacillus macerans]
MAYKKDGKRKHPAHNSSPVSTKKSVTVSAWSLATKAYSGYSHSPNSPNKNADKTSRSPKAGASSLGTAPKDASGREIPPSAGATAKAAASSFELGAGMFRS